MKYPLPSVLTVAERECFVVPPRYTVSEFADAGRRLPSGRKWKTEKTPYLRGLMDAFGCREVERITFKKSSQVGGTEAELNMLRYAVGHLHQDCLMIQPTKPLAESFGINRIQRMIDKCPVLKPMKSERKWDIKKEEIRLRGSTVYLAGAESPADLASRALPFVFWDETDKYPAHSGREASAIDLGWERTRTFKGRRKGVSASTPTTRRGYIHTQWEGSLKHRFHVPCPHCGHWQHLIFQRIKWPKDSTAESVEAEQSAHYECQECRGEIGEELKGGMISRGVWVPEGGEVPEREAWGGVGQRAECEGLKPHATHRKPNRRPKGARSGCGFPIGSGMTGAGKRMGTDGVGTIEGVLRGGIYSRGEVKKSRHWGFHINALYSPWLTWSDIAAQFLKSYKDPASLQNFVNSWEGEIWEEKIESVKVSELRRLVEDNWRMGEVPEGVQILTASIDVQASHFWGLIEGWGYNEESWVIWFGRLATWGEVTTLLNRAWARGAPPSPPAEKTPPSPPAVRRGEQLQVELAAIDSGNWAQDVYDFCSKDPSIYLPIKGSKNLRGPMFRGYPAEIDPDTGKPERNGLLLWMADTTRIKDRLTTRLRQVHPRLVHLPSDIPDDLIHHILGEHKVVDKGVPAWKQVTPGAPNHGWDCLVYSYLVMRILKQHLATGPNPTPPAPLPAVRKGGSEEDRERKGWVEKRRGWV